MNRKQRALLVIFLMITALIVALDNFFPGHPAVNLFKFGTMLALFLSTLIISKNSPEQVILNAAVFFMVVGDFFLDFCGPFMDLSWKVVPLGLLGFMLSYILLIAAYRKKFSVGPMELLASVPVLAVFILGLPHILPHISRSFLPGVAVFGVVLFFMAWISVSAPFSGLYKRGVAWRVALSGFLILISDLAVAHSLFNPAYAGQFTPWLKNIIWGTFIPAWTLIAANIAEDSLR